MSKKYYQNNKDFIKERNNANYKIYYTENKAAILQKKRNKYYQKRKCKHSLIDILPCDVEYKIYNMKHQLEFMPCLNYIEKMKYCYSHNAFVDLSLYKRIKNMLQPISYRKSFALILDYDGDAVFNICDCQLAQLKKDINAQIYMSIRCENLYNAYNVYDCAVVRFNDSRANNPILAIEIIELLVRLNFMYDGQMSDRVLLTDIEVKHLNRQFDQVYFELPEIY